MTFENFEASDVDLVEIGWIATKPKCHTWKNGTIEYATAVDIPCIDVEDSHSVDTFSSETECGELVGHNLSDDEPVTEKGGLSSMNRESGATVPYDLHLLNQSVTPRGTRKEAECVTPW